MTPDAAGENVYSLVTQHRMVIKLKLLNKETYLIISRNALKYSKYIGESNGNTQTD